MLRLRNTNQRSSSFGTRCYDFKDRCCRCYIFIRRNTLEIFDWTGVQLDEAEAGVIWCDREEIMLCFCERRDFPRGINDSMCAVMIIYVRSRRSNLSSNVFMSLWIKWVNRSQSVRLIVRCHDSVLSMSFQNPEIFQYQVSRNPNPKWISAISGIRETALDFSSFLIPEKYINY